MKKLFALFIIATTASAGIIAQNVNFIEITVEDTVRLKPVKIKYLITDSGTDYTNDYSDYKKEENKHAPQTNIPAAEKVLNSNKYSFTKYSETKTFRIDSYNYDTYKKKTDIGYGLLVEVNSVRDLENLYNLMKDQKGINGKILDVTFESKDTYIDPLFKSLFAKAQNEALMLASLTGLKIGKVISVTEAGSGNAYSIMDWYKDILVLDKYEDGMFGKDLSSVYSRKFTFKFEAN